MHIKYRSRGQARVAGPAGERPMMRCRTAHTASAWRPVEHGGATHITHKVLTLRISRRRAWRYDYVSAPHKVLYGHFSSYLLYLLSPLAGRGHFVDCGLDWGAGAPAPGRRAGETREK